MNKQNVVISIITREREWGKN